MKRIVATTVLLFVWLVLWLLPFHGQPVADASPEASILAQDCQQLVAEFHDNPVELNHFLMPVLENEAQRNQRLAEAQTILGCFQGSGSDLSDEDRLTRWAVRLFQVFVGDIDFPGKGVSQRGMVKFEALNDPAIVQLREEAHLPNPDRGDLFIWYFPSVEEMPVEIKPYFSDQQVQAVTIGTHYIAVLAGRRPNETSEQRSQRINKVLSHELVHAFINASIPPDLLRKQPPWYAEGLAIHFSGSSQPSSLVGFGPNGKEIKSMSYPPADYAQYRDNFEFLENKYGRSRFMELVNQSVVGLDPLILLSPLGIKDEAGLKEQARAARIWQSIQRIGLLLGGLLVAALLLAILIRPPSLSSGWLGGLNQGLQRRLHPLPNIATLSKRQDIAGLIRCVNYQNAHFPDEAAHVRIDAIRALARLRDASAVAPLLGALEHPQDELLRFELIRALGHFKQDDVVEALIEQLSQGGSTAVEAAGSLQRIGNPRALRPMLRRSAHLSNPYHQQMIGILVNWHLAHDLLRSFKNLLKHADGITRRETVRVLEKIPGEAALNLLLQALVDPDAVVRQEAIRAAAERGGDAAEAALHTYAQYAVGSFQAEMLEALAQVQSRLAVQLREEIQGANQPPPVE